MSSEQPGQRTGRTGGALRRERGRTVVCGWRAGVLAAAGLLSACGGAPTDAGAAGPVGGAKALVKRLLSGGESPPPPGDPLSCRLAGQAAFADGCTLEWLPGRAGADRPFLIHHADGGFRRFALSADGSSLDVADGSQPLTGEGPSGGVLTVQVGGDAYRLPLALLRRADAGKPEARR